VPPSSLIGTGVLNTLAGPVPDTTWTISGHNSGVVDGLSFNGFGNLAGTANNKDTFVFEHGGSVSGLVDGGAAGFDTMVLNGRDYKFSSSPTGPGSGSVSFEGQTTHYTGLEPILVGPTTDVSVTGATPNDTFEVLPDPVNVGRILVRSTIPSMESVSFMLPSNSITIAATGAGSAVKVIGDLAINGVNLLIQSGAITVDHLIDASNLGGVDGDVTLQASDAETGSIAANASVTLDGGSIKGRNVSLTATASSIPAAGAPSSHNLQSVGSAATVALLGASSITSSGNTSLASSSTVNAVVASSASPGGSTGVDAAVSGATVSSSASTHVSGTSTLAVTGSLGATAANLTSVTTTGDASTGDKGAGIAVALVTTSATSYIDSTGSAGITAGNLLLLADSNNTVATTAKTSPGGSTHNDQDPNPRTATADKPGGYANTSDGSIGIAGALAFNDLSPTTEAYIAPASTINISAAHAAGSTPPVWIHAGSSNSSAVTADGSTAVSGAPGVGVAIAVDIVHAVTAARVNNANFTAGGVGLEAVSATGGSPNSFSATSTSGAGSAATVGVAGSLSVNSITLDTAATVPDTGAATVSGDLTMTALSSGDVQAHALPGTTLGSKFGLGASVAVNVTNDTTTSGLGTGSTLSGVGNVTLLSTTGDTMTTEAQSGASSPSIAIAPVVAVSISNLTTNATLGTGSPLIISGALTATANQTATVTTNATGDVSGGSAAAGVSLALTIANHLVTATTLRNLTSTGSGNLVFSANGVSSTQANATASSSGAPGAGGGPGPTVTQQASAQRSFGDTVAPAGGGSGPAPTTPPAQTPDGAISVAAAIAVNIANTRSDASLGAVTLNTGGTVSLVSTANTDALAKADGSAAARAPPGSSATIGAAVAINLADASNKADVGSSAAISASGLTLSSTTSSPQTFAANAASAAGSGGTVGVAGSAAIEIVTLHTSAMLLGQADLSGGSLTDTAASSSTSTAMAAPDGTGSTSSNLGVGASLALNIVNDSTTAGLGDLATLANATNLVISAANTDAMATDAKMGASGGGVSVSPVVAVSISNVTSSATVGTAVATLTLGGGLTASASGNASVATSAGAVAAGGSAGIGVGLAITLGRHMVAATVARSVDAVGDVALNSTAYSSSSAAASASSSGAPDENSADKPAGGVDGQIAGARSNADSLAPSGGDSSGDGATPSAKTNQGGSANPLQVAAAVAVNIASSSSLAGLIGAAHLASGGAVALTSSAQTDAGATADGHRRT